MDLAAHCLQNDLKIKKSPLPPPPNKTAVSWGEKKGKKKSMVPLQSRKWRIEWWIEMMWEILYVGNMQFFPKIEAGQNHFNYLGINIVAFFPYPEWSTKTLQGCRRQMPNRSCPSCEVCSSCHALWDNGIDIELPKVIWKITFFRLLENWKACSTGVQCFTWTIWLSQ